MFSFFFFLFFGRKIHDIHHELNNQVLKMLNLLYYFIVKSIVFLFTIIIIECFLKKAIVILMKN